MSRRYALGPEDEAAYARLERSLQIGPETGRALVASDSTDVRYEVRRRVGEILRVEVVRPGDDVVTMIHAVREAAGAPVLVWIEGEPGVGPESEAWRQTYAALNMGRDVLAEKGRVSLVLAGPVALEQQVRTRAPDFVTMVRPVLVLGTRLELVGEGYAAGTREGGGDRQEEALARKMAEVLARILHDEGDARMVASRAGVPREQLPRFGKAVVFWHEVVDGVSHGMGDRRRLIDEAARLFPGNPELAELGKAIRATDVRAEDLCVWLRRLAVAKYRNHVFAQLPVGTPKPLGLVWDAVVPLDFQEHEIYVGRDEGGGRPGLRAMGATIDLAALVARIDPVGDDEPAGGGVIRSPRRALAILGDPGSGKSTLCRWLAATIAERETGLAPILVEAVAWMSREGSGTLVDAMMRAADGGSGAIDVADLRGLCDDGRIVLLVDGYDEPVRTRARSKMRDELEDFSSKFPKVAIVVTSRVEGYLEAPLPQPWQTLVVAPFDEGKLEDFVKRWYAMVEPDPEARARGRAELVAALAAEPRAREMARNPLLATLIAEVHHHRKTPLPGRRSELYELVVELLLVTRPREREHIFEGMKEDDQRARLERFALWLQEQRSAEDGADIVFDREDFVREVMAPMAGRQDVSRRVAQRWLEWLVRETGLVREGKGGHCSFLHLSLMEYLAAHGVLARFVGDLEGLSQFIVRVSYEGCWREVTLLLFGTHADNGSIASLAPDSVLGGSGGTFSAQHAVELLLGLLMEEVNIPSGARVHLLSRAVMFGEPALVSAHLERVIRHSRRHGRGTEQWLLSRILEGEAWEAVRIAVASPPFLRSELHLAKRNDIADVGPSFLDESLLDYGAWAAVTLPKGALLHWAAEASVEAAFPMAISRLAVPGCLARLWSVAALSRCDVRSLLPRGCGFSAILAVRWEADDLDSCSAVMPACLVEKESLTRRRHLSWRAGALHAREGIDFRRSVMANVLGVSHDSEEVRLLSLLYDSVGYLPIIPHEKTVLAANVPQRMFEFLGVMDARVKWYEDRALVPTLPNQAAAQHGIAIVALMRDVHAALLMSPTNVTAHRLIRLRLDNLFIHDFFDGLASLALERGTEHDCLPLLLALGFAQYQTTWSWPHSRHWQQWFSSPPPADWLAAYFWHLCWAVGDVDRFPEHYAAAQACLDRADWPELAAELRAYTIRPMTVEEWQRNADPTPVTDPPPAPET